MLLDSNNLFLFVKINLVLFENGKTLISFDKLDFALLFVKGCWFYPFDNKIAEKNLLAVL